MSNRLTFSLASLIVLIAFGMVFVASPAMAHSGRGIQSHTQHPVLEALPAIDANGDGDTTDYDAGDFDLLPVHGVHPVPTITVKPNAADADPVTVKGNEIIITADDTTTSDIAENTFRVVISFADADGMAIDVDDVATATAAADDITIAAGDFNILLLDKMGVPVTTGNASIAVARFGSDPVVATDPIEAVVTIPDASVPTGTADMSELTIRLQLRDGSTATPSTTGVWSLQKDVVVGATTVTVPGGHNLMSNLAEFKLVQEFTEPPTAPDPPTDLMADTDHEAGTVTLTWTALEDTMYEYMSDETGSTWADATSPQEVTGLTPDTDITLSVRVKAVAATATAAAVPAGTPATVDVHIDQTAPTVTVMAPAKDPSATTLTFTIDFNEMLGTGLSALTITDFDIDGGSAMAADLTGPDADHDYELEVTPDSADASVTVTLMANTVADAVGNVVDVTDMDNTPSDTYDITPPTVMISPPDMPDADGNLTFTFDFSEDVMADTITLDRSGSDNVRLGANSDPVQDADDSTIYTILVEPRNPEVDTTVLLLKGSVMDMNGNGLAADAEATYSVGVDPPTDTAPSLTGTIPSIVIWAGHTYKTNEGDFPKATDTEGTGDRIRYRIEPELPSTFTLTHDDLENRYLEIENAAAMAQASYNYIAYNELSDGTTVDSDPIAFSITVLAQVVPTMPTMVMAMEEGAVDQSLTGAALAAAIRARMVNTNNVVVDWTAPVDTTTPARTLNPVGMSEDVPFGSPVTAYKVYRHDSDANQQAVYNVADKDATSYTTVYNNGLRVAKYIFTVSAVNGVGEGPQSTNPNDDNNVAIVLDPPNPPYNVDPSANTDGTVSLSWLPEESPVNVPMYRLNNAMPADELMYGYVQFHLIHITPPGADTDTIEVADADTTDLIGTALDEIGTYTFRVSAVNIDGVGERSIADIKFEVTRPIGATNSAPSFGDYTVDDIVVTLGDRVGMTLGRAMDADAGDTLSYTLLGADGSDLPAGLTFDDASRRLSGTTEGEASEGEYVYAATDSSGASDTLKFYIQVKAKEVVTGPPSTSTPVTVLPANGYIIYIRDLENRPNFGTANPAVAEWSDMPNLYELFSEGGGGSLQLNVTGVSARQVVMSEVMWAVDLGKVGQDSYDGNQWIELRNRTGNGINISDISFAFKADGRPALPQGTDLISNVVGAGNDWIKDGKGQNGNSTPGALREFISMERKRYHNDSAGWNPGEWNQSTIVYHPNYKGTPGRGEPTGPAVIGTTNVPRSPMIFNEIANFRAGSEDYEWIELRNVSGGNVNLKNWEITMVTAVGTDVDLVDFTGADRNIPAGEVVLIVKSDPTGDESHPLAAGWNFGATNAWAPAGPGQANYVPGVNADSPRYIVAATFNALPDDGEFVLVLRNRQDRNGSTGNDNIRDIAGHVPGTRLQVNTANAFTNLWPLSNFHNANAVQNKFTAGTVHRRQHAGTNGTDRSRRDRGGNADDGAFRDDGWTGIGYKRNAAVNAQNGGTPGYKHGVLRSNDADANAAVIISEIMPTKGDRNLPEWIELRNVSKTIGINVDNWRLTITNHDSDGAEGTYDGDLSHTITLSGRIPPGQTYLIVARNGRNATSLPSQRVKNVGRARTQHLINSYGFELKLQSKKDNNYLEVDTVGNLGEAEGRRSRSFAPIIWEWPESMDESGDRISIVRTSISGAPVADGTTRMAWSSFETARQPDEVTYYGHQSDFGSPGHTAGGVLPVSLSAFRADRLATGGIVIRWTTESETNNAGFNILRSDSRDGEFTKLNTQLIAGQGTTSERNVYSFTDASAKPNVVYYYQIQDVSFDGDVATLKTSRLRGHVTPGGKLTTTWGELKTLQ